MQYLLNNILESIKSHIHIKEIKYDTNIPTVLSSSPLRSLFIQIRGELDTDKRMGDYVNYTIHAIPKKEEVEEFENGGDALCMGCEICLDEKYDKNISHIVKETYTDYRFKS